MRDRMIKVSEEEHRLIMEARDLLQRRIVEDSVRGLPEDLQELVRSNVMPLPLGATIEMGVHLLMKHLEAKDESLGETMEKALKHRVAFVQGMLESLQIDEEDIDRVLRGYRRDFRGYMRDPEVFEEKFREATGQTPEEYVRGVE